MLYDCKVRTNRKSTQQIAATIYEVRSLWMRASDICYKYYATSEEKLQELLTILQKYFVIFRKRQMRRA